MQPAPRPRLVVAEDQALIRLDLERLLEDAGFEVCGSARDGKEAVELVHELRPDLVLLDVKMPRIDGVDAARRILDDGFVPIVMLTAYGYGELISRALDAGVVGFVVVRPSPAAADRPRSEPDLGDVASGLPKTP